MNQTGEAVVGSADFLSRKEVAGKFDVTERTIDNWRRQFKMPHYRIGGRIRFDRSEVEAWMKDLRHGGPIAAPKW